MPVIFSTHGFKFRFFASDSGEPKHIHVNKGEGHAKIWMEPELRWQFCYGFKKPQKREIFKIVKENLELFKHAWYEYFKNI